MPIVGSNYKSRIEIGGFRTPKNYVSKSRRKYHPGPDSREFNYWNILSYGNDTFVF